MFFLSFHHFFFSPIISTMWSIPWKLRIILGYCLSWGDLFFDFFSSLKRLSGRSKWTQTGARIPEQELMILNLPLNSAFAWKSYDLVSQRNQFGFVLVAVVENYTKSVFSVWNFCVIISAFSWKYNLAHLWLFVHFSPLIVNGSKRKDKTDDFLVRPGPCVLWQNISAAGTKTVVHPAEKQTHGDTFWGTPRTEGRAEQQVSWQLQKLLLTREIKVL